MFKLSEALQCVNQALNFPSVTFIDMSKYFNQAIAELNTSLRIALPTVTEMVQESSLEPSKLENCTPISQNELSKAIATAPDKAAAEVILTAPDSIESAVYCTGDHLFYIRVPAVEGSEELIRGYVDMYGVCFIDGSRKIYQAVRVALNNAQWVAYTESAETLTDLNNWLPTDWIVLFMIPYVCAKYATREGIETSSFIEDYVQGFQQLQTSYNVPNKVFLPDVAHVYAYTELVKQHLADNTLKTYVPVRAITSAMLGTNFVVRDTPPMFHTGGWSV